MNSPTEEQLGAAFRDLVAAQPFTPDVSAIEHRARRARRRDRIVRGGIGAGAVAVAAVAAVGVASAVPSAPARPARRRRTRWAGERRAPGENRRVNLPDRIDRRPAATGDAGRRAGRRTGADRQRHAGGTRDGLPGKASINVWDLYTDDGRYFFSQTKAGLPGTGQGGQQPGRGMFGREVAAATYAATGNLDTAALKMAWASNTTPVPAWLSAQVKNMSEGGLQIDNYVWEGCEDALIVGSGNPQVRAGVLRLVSALPGIAVTHGTVDGQSALTLTAGAAEVGYTGINTADPKAAAGPAYQEAISINANTGIPLRIVGGSAGQVSVNVSYVVTRVSLADIAAGKF